MKEVFTKVYRKQEITLDPIYMTKEQWKYATYIPEEYRSRVIIVDFIEEEETEDERK